MLESVNGAACMYLIEGTMEARPLPDDLLDLQRLEVRGDKGGG